MEKLSLEEKEGEEEVEVENEDYDEEEEDEYVGSVTLGFVEKPKNLHNLLRYLFPSKAGGIPAWLDPVNLPEEKSRICGFCGEPLQFLLQVYAPISEKESTFHRTLFVFMCPSMECLLKDQHEQWKRKMGNPYRSVRVFRCQLPRSNPFYSSEPPRHDGTDKPFGTGVPLCCWCGTWKGEKVCSSCKRTRYCSEKHQVMHWQSGHRKNCKQIIISSPVSDTLVGSHEMKLPAMDKVACTNLWPEFEIVNEDEGAFDAELSEYTGSATDLVAKEDKEDETFQYLSDKYEANDDGKSWASFQQRIAKAPEQVLRYCREVKAKPLWPVSTGKPSNGDIPKCNYCNGSLSYEFQILPQLLYYFNVRNDPDSLDWATIVMYTCTASCEASLSYKEELAWVQLQSSSAVPL